MKLFIKLRNKCFTACMALALLVLASIGVFKVSLPRSVEASMVKFDNEKSVTITNGSFTSFSSSSKYPYSLSNYTITGNSTPSMKAGAINVSDKEFKDHYEDYGLTEYSNPGKTGDDNYILMINTDEDSNYTYASKEFTLAANGYYYVTVSAKTIGDSSVASVFLMKDNKVFEDCLIQNITSNGWANYTFFVETNSYESVTLQFGMQIGSQSTRASGCVLFDELHAAQISRETFANCISTFPEDSFKIAHFREKNAYKAYMFDEHIIDFSQDVNNPSITNANYFADSVSGGGEKTVDINNGILNISTNGTYVNYTGQEEELLANSTYKFTIEVNASQISSGSAFVKLEEILDDEEEYDDFMESTTDDIEAKSSKLTLTTKTSNTLTKGYDEYTIYVRTGALKDSKVKFSFGLGTDSENAKGQVSFKNFTIERVPYSAFSAATAGSKIGKIDIAERIKLSSNEYANYTFDKMESSSFDGVPYPATPSDWTKAASGNGYQLSGVVNLSKFTSVMEKYDSYINKIATPNALNSLNNNVLMMYNGANSTQSYTSSSKSLSADNQYKITAFVNTHMWDADAHGVTVLAKADSNVLAKAENIKTNGNWQRVEFYITTPNNSVNLTLELALGYDNKLSSGYAFFDNILVEEAAEDGTFSNRFSQFLVANNGSVTVDLTNPTLSFTTQRDYNIPVLYKGENKGETTINAGIVDLTGDLNAIIADAKMESLRSLDSQNKNVLAISTALNKDSYYKYTSVLQYNFASDKYYKLSFELFTDGIAQEDKENNRDNGALAQGANIHLTGLENATFKYATSDGKWTTYEFYIGVNSTVSSNLVFSLGSEFTGCYGRAFLGNIVLSEMEEDEFKAQSSSSTVLKIDTIEQEEENEESSTSTSSSSSFSWAYIPTIATFLAIVVAVVGVFVRRNIKFKKRVGNKKAVYDRDITVLQNKYRRLASDRREKEVRELTKECNELIALRTTYEEKYKEALSRLRSAKLSNRDGSKRHEVLAIEREVKHISKEVARYGVQVNNYENEIEFMQTEAYLIDLEKQMMREDNYARNQVRKEAELPEEKRQELIAKREEKQARAKQKAEAKAEKVARKQAKLQEERESIEVYLLMAKEKDAQLAKEQELRKIKLEEERLAKEKAKAEKELAKLEQQRKQQEAEAAKAEESKSEAAETEVVENNAEQTEQVENNAEQAEIATADVDENASEPVVESPVKQDAEEITTQTEVTAAAETDVDQQAQNQDEPKDDAKAEQSENTNND